MPTGALKSGVVQAVVASCILTLAVAAPVSGQTMAGLDPTSEATPDTFTESAESVVQVAGAYPHTSLVFTVADIVLFSYSDGTLFELHNDAGTLIWNNGGTPLDKGDHALVTVPTGVYTAKGSQKFAVLTGDPISRYVSGYYAMDQDGYGTSREFYTWVPQLYGHCEFIIFAYEDGTDVTVEYTDSGTPVASFSLDAGEHWNINSLSAKWLHIVASKQVSALTAYDQGYYVPADTGRWSGTLFHTYVGDVQRWPQDLTVMAFNDGTFTSITDSDTGTTLWSGTLDSGDAHTLGYPGGANKYFTVTATDLVTVAVVPWVSYTSSYHQGAYVQDATGSGIGHDLIGSTLNGGYLHVFSYTDGAVVDIYDSRTGVHAASYTLNRGDHVNANPGNGLWRIVSIGTVGAYSGWGQWNADFAPVEFGEVFNPLNLNKDDGLAEACATGEITYTISFDNLANSYDVNGVAIIDTLPEQADFVSATAGGMYDSGARTATWDIGTLAAGAGTQSVQLVVELVSATPGEEITNSCVIDSDETPPTTRNETSTVCLNQPPVAICQDVTVSAGPDCTAAASVDNGSYDPDGDPITLTQAPAGPYPLGDTVVMLTVTDDGGLSGSCTGTVTVIDDTSPVIESLDGAPLVQQVGADIAFFAVYSDNCEPIPIWDFPGAAGFNVDDPTNPTCWYADPGIYTVTLTVADGGGNSVMDSLVVVVYDPTDGFVTGGGWIDSPEGAYMPDPSLIGKANFGFVSKYKKNSHEPDGQTEFQFHVADLNFHSSGYEWLVVTGSNYAMFKGSGTINGEGDYRFRIWAGDDDPDTFRIKIWLEDENTGEETVVYDNGFDQEIAGGSIKIHKS